MRRTRDKAVATDLAQLKIEVVVNGVPDAAARLRAVETAIDGGKKAAKGAGDALRGLNTEASRPGIAPRFTAEDRAAKTLLGTLNQIKAAVAGYVGIRTLFDIGKTAMDLASVEAGFRSITGSAAGAGDTMAWLRSEAQRLGQDFLSLTDGFKGFSAAGKAAGMDGEAVRSVFRDISEAAVALQLDGAKTERVFYALEQMLSKGVVSMEELRQQMGESLPGAFTIAARAMGKTEQEFAKMVEKGEVASREFVTKFAPAIKEAFGSGFAAALETPRAELARLVNEINFAKEEIGKAGFLQGISEGAKELRAALQTEDIRDNLQQLGHAFGEITAGLAKLAAFAANNGAGLLALAAGFGAAAVAGKTLIPTLKAVTESVAAKIAAETSSRDATLASAKAEVDAASKRQARIAWKLRQIDLTAKHAIGTKNEERAVAMLTVQRQKLAAADDQLAVAERNLARAQSAFGAGAARTAGMLKALGQGLLGAFGGPVGLAVTALAGGVAYLSLQQSEGEKYSARYAESIGLIAQGGDAAAAALKSMGEEIAKMSEKARQAELLTAEKAIADYRRKLADMISEGASLADMWNKEAGARLEGPFEAAYKKFVVTSKEFRDEIKLIGAQKGLEEKAEEISNISTALESALFRTEQLGKASEAGAGTASRWAEEARKLSEAQDEVGKTLARIDGQGAPETWEEAYTALRKLTKQTEESKASALENAKAQARLAVETLRKQAAAEEAAGVMSYMSGMDADAAGQAAVSAQYFARAAQHYANAKRLMADASNFEADIPNIKLSGGSGGADKAASALKSITDELAKLTMTEKEYASFQLSRKYEEWRKEIGKTTPELEKLISLERTALGAGFSSGGEMAKAITEIGEAIANMGLTRQEIELKKFEERIKGIREALDKGMPAPFTKEQLAQYAEGEQKFIALGSSVKEYANVLKDFEKEYQQAFQNQGGLAASITTEMNLFRAAAVAAYEAGTLGAEGYAKALERIDELQRYKLTESATDMGSGIARGFRKAGESAQNYAALSESMVVNAFQGMEDTMAQFVKTGKLDFSSLVDSMITDMIRLSYRMMMFVNGGGSNGLMGGLAGVLGSVVGGLFSSGSSSYLNYNSAGGVVQGGSIDWSSVKFASSSYHSGGIVGKDGMPTGPVPASLWRDAARYHSGGFVLAPGEVPIIAQRGERVLSRAETAAYNSSPVVVNKVEIIDQRGTNAPPAEVQQTPNANGGMDYRVIIKAEVQKNFSSGAMDGVMAGRYGVKPRVNGR